MISQDKKELLDKLKKEGYLKNPRIISVFQQIPRDEFVPKEAKAYAYMDRPIEIGYGQTISAPHMVAIMTELLDPQPGDKVLEIGGGSGYQAAILSNLVKKVYSIELEPDLVSFAKANLRRTGIKNVEMIQGDGSKGYPKNKPYDKILVACATPKIFESWLNQLRTGGIIMAPQGTGFQQDLMEITKTNKGIKKKNHGGCVFVPLRY